MIEYGNNPKLLLKAISIIWLEIIITLTSTIQSIYLKRIDYLEKVFLMHIDTLISMTFLTSCLVIHFKLKNVLNEEISKHDEFPLISNETSLFSTKYNIKGRVDAIVNFKNSKIPWDYKTGYDPIFFDYNKVQILCYCPLLQDNGYDAPFGTIDYVDLGVQEHIKLNYNNRKLVNSIIANVINMTINKQIPKLFKCNYYKHNQYCIHCSKLSEVN